jgi:hypothetical protein
MKKLFFALAIILMTGTAFGQTFQKGNLVGFHVGTVNLDPDVTFNQWKKFALETYIPAVNKEFEGEITTYLAFGERGKYKNYVGWYMIFKSVEIRDKYIPEEAKRSELYNAKWAKVNPIFEELMKMGTFSTDHWTDWVIQ